MNTRMARAAAAAGGLAIAAAFAVSCSQAKETTKDIASGASSIGSSAASAAGGAASSAGSAASSAVSSGASAASSVVSSGASAASSAVSSGASAASSVVSSGASAASSAVSSVASDIMDGAGTTMNVPGVGDVALDGPTAAAYTRLGGASALGAPTGMSEKVGDGTVTPFDNGTIFSSPKGSYLVQGEILKQYMDAQGGPTGALGWPTADEASTGGGASVAGGGWIGEFQNGTISWLNDGKGNFSETVTKR